MNRNEITFAPSPWPLIGSVFILPVVMIATIFLFADFFVAIISTFILVAFFFFGMANSVVLKVRTLNAVGALNRVTLSPQGVVHHSLTWFRAPKTYTYSWSDIHSLRPHHASHAQKMIAFSPVQADVGKFFRGVDGAYGVPHYGRGDEMLETMIDYHEKYASNGLPSVEDGAQPPLLLQPVLTQSQANLKR